MGVEPTEIPCECGGLRMMFRLWPRVLPKVRGPKIVYLCHTCDADHPLVAERLRLSAAWKAQGRGALMDLTREIPAEWKAQG